MNRKMTFLLLCCLISVTFFGCEKEQIVGNNASAKLNAADQFTKDLAKTGLKNAVAGLKNNLVSVIPPDLGDPDPNAPLMPTKFSEVPGLTQSSDNYLFELQERELNYSDGDIDLAITDLLSDKSAIMTQSNYTADDLVKLTAINHLLEVLDYIKYENYEGYYPNYSSFNNLDNTTGITRLARVDGCHVKWKNVWRAAVFGFFAEGIKGAFVGCAAGTVALPLVGTASGCVGGAVFGAAGGFISGAVGAIGWELFNSCNP